MRFKCGNSLPLIGNYNDIAKIHETFFKNYFFPVEITGTRSKACAAIARNITCAWQGEESTVSDRAGLF